MDESNKSSNKGSNEAVNQQTVKSQPTRATASEFATSQRNMVGRILFVQVCLFTFFSLFCLFAGWHWFADIVNSFRVQFSFILILFVAFFLVFRQWVGVIVNTSLFAFHFIPLAPYLFAPAAAQVSEAPKIKIMSANINGENKDYQGLIQEILKQSPDFVTLIEIKQNWQPELEKLIREYPYQKYALRKKNDNYGLAVLSKIKPVSMELREFDSSSLPSIETKFVIHGKEISIVSMHPPAPFGVERSRIRNENLLYAANQLSQEKSRIMLGDFNMTPWSPHFGKVLQTGKLKDSSIGFGLSPTWFEIDFFLFGLKIDHILASPDLVPVNFHVSPNFGSDHRAVTAVFEFDR